MSILNYIYMYMGKQKYICPQKPAFVTKRMEGIVECQSLMLILF